MLQLHTLEQVNKETASPVDRRAWVRYECDWDSACQPLAGGRGTQWQGKIRNLSRGGLAIALRRRFEIGTILAIGMQGPADGARNTFLARVAHVATQTDGSWLLGCSFKTPLTEEELQALL